MTTKGRSYTVSHIGGKLNGKRIHYHIYMDTAALMRTEFRELVEEYLDDHATFFTVKETTKRGSRVLWNQEAIRSYRDNYVGYWTLFTTRESDAERAFRSLDWYNLHLL